MKSNVIIFVVDSARYYSTGGLDDRDKLKMMDDFEKESIFFSTAVASAPSSVMSCASMLTGLPAYYIARNYEDFKYDNDLFISLPKILNSHGYETKSNFVAREMRDKYGTIIPQIGRKYWPAGLSENTKIENLGFVWSNNQLNDVLEKYLANRSNTKPLFLLNWYNIRIDPNTSQEVERGINALKKANLWDNSIFLLLADHGYMDPRRGYTPEKLKEMRLSHDLVLFDDNIRIPFYMRFPNCIPQKIDTQISTYDILPTIIEFIDLPLPKNMGYELYGKSLLNLINKSDEGYLHFEKVRTDGRFFAQNDRCTSIRSHTYKYIIRPDTNIEEFYNLYKDPKEETDLINDPRFKSVIDEFREYYHKTETDAVKFQTQYILSKLLKNKDLMFFNNEDKKILFLAFGTKNFNTIISSVLQKIFNKSQYFTYDLDSANENVFDYKLKYDLLISLTDIDDSVKDIQNQLIKKISFRKTISVNPNMDTRIDLNKKSTFTYLLITMLKKSKYYFLNPKYFLSHLKLGISRLIKSIN